MGRELFAAVARLTELAGYMAVDTGQPGLAQRYYIQSLRLAQAAGDRAYGGYVLAASMSHLAASLGNPREIAQFARAAQEGARGQVTPPREAMFHAAEARGHALLGDARSCQSARAGADAMEQRRTPERRTTRPGSRTSTTPTSRTNSRTVTATSARPEPAARRAPRRRSPATPRPAPGAARSDCSCSRARRCSSVRSNAPATRGTEAAGLLRGLRSDRGAEYLDDFRRRLEPYARGAGGAGVLRAIGDGSGGVRAACREGGG